MFECLVVLEHAGFFLALAAMRAIRTVHEIAGFGVFRAMCQEPSNSSVIYLQRTFVKYLMMIGLAALALGIGACRGPAGPQGNTGNQGNMGNQGNTGDTGAKGNTGNTGNTGSTGSTGASGSNGSDGRPATVIVR